MKHQGHWLIFLLLSCVAMPVSGQYVGIGEPTPNSKLDISNDETTGAALEVTHTSLTNTSEALDVNNGGAGSGATITTSNAANTQTALFVTHAGSASAVVATVTDNTIPGTISVGDFSYTGTDVADHVGVEGNSSPAVGWGIGVHGTGGYYGVFSAGDLGASGTKTFLIDHPLDPENKMLRHFSVESNEVLNLYRGIAVFDDSGRAVIQLPDYFEAVNVNFSYQLTPIGSPQQPWIVTEITNNQFEVAGAPGTKVSWTVMANRHDPYMQQHPEKTTDEVVKDGLRQGRYIQPVLYGQPQSASMFGATPARPSGVVTPTAKP